jgi:hypothetical protein
MFTVQDRRWGTREQLDGGTVEVQVAGVLASWFKTGPFRAFLLPCETIFARSTLRKTFVRFDKNLAGWVDSGWDVGRWSGEEPPDIFPKLQDEDDNGEPNAVVDGLIDDLRDARSIGRSA